MTEIRSRRLKILATQDMGQARFVDAHLDACLNVVCAEWCLNATDFSSFDLGSFHTRHLDISSKHSNFERVAS